MLHGKTAAKKAEQTAKETFEKGTFGDDLPVVNVKKNQISSGLNIIDLVITTNLLNSKSEVRRAIKNKGIKINNETVEDEKLSLSIDKFDEKNVLKISHGKKRHVLLKLV